MRIDVSLDVYKELTRRLSHEGQSYDDILRELLALDSPVEYSQDIETPSDMVSAAITRALDSTNSFVSRGLKLPLGTVLQARYKGERFAAKIESGKWLDEAGCEHSSPSAAAAAITGTNVNGLRFWEARLPGQSTWCRLDTLVRP